MEESGVGPDIGGRDRFPQDTLFPSAMGVVMPSRRSILSAAVAMVGAGCITTDEPEINPDEHVPDEWHDEPQRGLSDPITMIESELSQHPHDDCPYLAAETVSEAIDERLDDPEHVSGGGCCEEINGHERAIVAERLLTVDRDGEVVSSPNVTFQAMREVIPRTVKASEASDHTCRVPVYVEDTMIRLA